MIKILLISLFVGSLGFLPVHTYNSVVEPQLKALESTYDTMDQTAQSVANGQDVDNTDTYKNAKALAN